MNPPSSTSNLNLVSPLNLQPQPHLPTPTLNINLPPQPNLSPQPPTSTSSSHPQPPTSTSSSHPQPSTSTSTSFSPDAIVAGAGIWGCTVARRLAEAGKKVLVLEKRNAIGGNCRCEIDSETGIEIHTYGSHIFHTHNRQVWDFIRRFTEFNGYQHKVLANYRGKTYHLPLGLTLVNKFFGVELRPDEVEAFLNDGGRRQAIFDAFFRGYTSKQWGKAPEDIDPSIIKRVPVRTNYDTNYFNDYWQGIPAEGYNELFRKMLDHPNITLRCNHSVKVEKRGEGEERLVIVDEVNKTTHPLSPLNLPPQPGIHPQPQPSTSTWSPLSTSTSNLNLLSPLSTSTSNLNLLSPLNLYYSGPIDELFGYKYGALPWRSLRFERETLPVADFQGTTVMNYTEAEVPYTRIHEFKHYHPEAKGQVEKVGGGGERPAWGFDAPKTVIMREYPADWQKGDEPYYPINTPESAALLAKYQEAVEKLNNLLSTSTSSLHLIIGGRLGGYKYYDMDKSIEAALKVDI